MDFGRVLAAASGGSVDPNLLIAIVTGVFAIAGLVLSARLGNKKEDRVAKRSMEAENRSLEDYVNVLRAQLKAGGLTPAPYPAELRDLETGG